MLGSFVSLNLVFDFNVEEPVADTEAMMATEFPIP